MPSNDTAKIKSAPKRFNWLRILGIALAVIALLAPLLFYRSSSRQLDIGNRQIALTVADTPATRAQGLSGQKSMPQTQGMLFELGAPSKACFWMKGMEFPLDIIWTTSAKKVIYIAPRLSPGSYPTSFCPPENAMYVLELNSGQAARLGIRLGKTLHF